MSDQSPAAQNYYRFKKIFSVIVFTLTRVEVEGLDFIPRQAPFILALNHTALLDTPLMLVTIPRYITVLVAEKWRETPLWGYLLQQAGGIFIDRDNPDRRAIRRVLALLKAGGVIGMAPEGTRSKTGGLMRAKPGVAYLAQKAGVPVIPIGISGQIGYGKKLLRLQRPRLRVKIGPPIHLPPLYPGDRAAQLQAQADDIMRHLARLIDPDLRGIYANSMTPGIPFQPVAALKETFDE